MASKSPRGSSVFGVHVPTFFFGMQLAFQLAQMCACPEPGWQGLSTNGYGVFLSDHSGRARRIGQYLTFASGEPGSKWPVFTIWPSWSVAKNVPFVQTSSSQHCEETRDCLPGVTCPLGIFHRSARLLSLSQERKKIRVWHSVAFGENKLQVRVTSGPHCQEAWKRDNCEKSYTRVWKGRQLH